MNWFERLPAKGLEELCQLVRHHTLGRSPRTATTATQTETAATSEATGAAGAETAAASEATGEVGAATAAAAAGPVHRQNTKSRARCRGIQESSHNGHVENLGDPHPDERPEHNAYEHRR